MGWLTDPFMRDHADRKKTNVKPQNIPSTYHYDTSTMDIAFALPADLTGTSVFLLAVILAASGIMSGLSGFGFSAIGAISLSLLHPALAIPLLMSLSTANQLLSMGQLRNDLKPLNQWWPDGPAPYLIGGAIGVPIGLWLLQSLPVPALMVGFGVFLMGYASYSMLKPNGLTIEAPKGTTASTVIGALGGVLGGVTAFPGAPLVIWAGLTRMSKEEARSIVQPYIFCMQILSLLLLAVFSPTSFSAEFWTLLVILLPVVLPCIYLGTVLYRKLSDMNFRRVAFMLLGSSGLGIFIKGSHTLKLLSTVL